MDQLNDNTLLFVDDEQEILELLQHQYGKLAPRVLTADCPSKALEIFRRERVDVVVLDLSMPQKDGITLLREIRQIQPDAQAIFLTGHGEKDSIQAAIRLGAVDFVDKPFDDEYLRSCLVRSLEKVGYEKALRELLELLVTEYTHITYAEFSKYSPAEKERVLNATLGLTKIKLLNKQLGSKSR